MITILRYILLTALRDRLFLGLLAAVLCAAGVSYLLGTTALVENQQMILVYTAGSSRLVLAVGLIVFVCFHIRQAFDTREIELTVTRPISRERLVFAYWLGFAAVAALLTLPVIALLAALRGYNVHGLIGWSASLVLESLLVVAIALFTALTLRSAVSAVMASLGFYVLSRMMGFFLATAKSGLLFSEATVNAALKQMINALSIVVPRLDFFAKTEWLVYGIAEPKDMAWMALQALVFVPLIVAAALIDFKRRQF